MTSITGRQAYAVRPYWRQPSVFVSLLVILVVAVIWGVTAIRAAQPPTLDQRAYDVGSQLICPVCNGESVADSSSQVAADMRAVIVQKLKAGESEQQVLQYFHDHYGDTILERPPFQGFTLMIWLGPVIILLVGLFVLRTVARQWGMAKPALAGDGSTGEDANDMGELSAEERARYRRMLRRELDAEEGLDGLLGKEGV
jgi:cytochrome c-type biogenesis protein CcmH